MRGAARLRRIRCAGVALALLFAGALAAPLQAQSADTAVPEETSVDLIGPPAPGPGDLDAEGAALAAWYSLANRAEGALTDGLASEFALMRLRAAVVDWRDRFLADENVNAARILTVMAQLAALGPAPEGDVEEESRIATRRVELEAQLRKLRAPVRLAQEGFAHADGLVSEIDTALRGLRAQGLRARGASPLDPRLWPEAVLALGARAGAVLQEMRTNLGSAARREELKGNAVWVTLMLLVAFVLLQRGQVWVTRVLARVTQSARQSAAATSGDTGTAPLDGDIQTAPPGGDTDTAPLDGDIQTAPLGGDNPAASVSGATVAEETSSETSPAPPAASGASVWIIVLGFCQVALPLIGLFALREGLLATGMFGYRMTGIVNALPEAGASIILARWFATQFFAPDRAERSSLEIDVGVRARIRRLLEAMGWILAFGQMLDAFLSAGEKIGPAVIVAQFPVSVALAIVLFRLGKRFTRTRAKVAEGNEVARPGLVLPTFGRLLMVIGVLGVGLQALGYTAASEALIVPAILTMALMGGVTLLQRVVFDVFALIAGGKTRGDDALAPVVVGFVLVLLALPVLALIWGARTDDLMEIWAKFREGYSLGERRISPTDLFTFAAVFALGYFLTRLLQSTLRRSILPRTRLDTGARNAIIAGLGYIGIFAAALAAITSAGIDLSSFAIVAGALSVGIGFGLQNIVSNFVSGIILLIERPVSEGDWIEVGTQMGYVRAISVRSTRIETFDRTDVIIPNADLVSGTVTNWTRNNSVGRVKVPVGVAYGTDTNRVDKILREVAAANPMVLLQPPPNVFFLGFGADSMDFEIRAILRDINFVMVVTSEMNHAIAARFAAEGIEIPYPQRDIWLRNPESLRTQGESATQKGVVPSADLPVRQLSDTADPETGHPMSDDISGHPMSDDISGHPMSDDISGHPMSDDISGHPMSDDISGHKDVRAPDPGKRR